MFSLELVEGGFFKIEASSPDMLVIIPTKSCSKYMMKLEGKERVEDNNSPTKVTRKWALAEAKEI